MSILYDLKTKAIVERKARGPLVAFYSFVISEIATIGKNDGNRDTTDDEAIRMIKKLIAVNEVQAEIDVISGYVPTTLSEDETRTIIEGYGLNQIGAIMGRLKKEYGQRVDMKIASQIAKECT